MPEGLDRCTYRFRVSCVKRYATLKARLQVVSNNNIIFIKQGLVYEPVRSAFWLRGKKSPTLDIEQSWRQRQAKKKSLCDWRSHKSLALQIRRKSNLYPISLLHSCRPKRELKLSFMTAVALAAAGCWWRRRPSAPSGTGCSCDSCILRAWKPQYMGTAYTPKFIKDTMGLSMCDARSLAKN